MKARFVCYLLYYAIQTYINCINAINCVNYFLWGRLFCPPKSNRRRVFLLSFHIKLLVSTLSRNNFPLGICFAYRI